MINLKSSRHWVDIAIFLILGCGCNQVDNVERENAAAEVAENHVFVPQYRSGGCSERGIRQTLEDALICFDDLHDRLHDRGAFYGVSFCFES